MSDMIMVVAHKLFDDSILPAGYVPIKVGTVLDNSIAKKKGWMVDSEGHNIADENPYYCELTAQYWVWKNCELSDTDIIGLSHYRRFFFDYKKDSKKFSEDILSVDAAKEILKKHKIIMNFTTVKLPGKAYLYKNIPDEKQNKHWRIMKDIIVHDYPDMIGIFNRYMFGRYTVWGNMFVTSKEVFSEYNEWIFDVMKKYDLAIEQMGEERIPRVDGFLTEHLLLIWANYKFKKNDIYHLEVRNTEQDSFEDYKNSFKGRIMHFIRTHRFLLVMARKIRVGFLLLKRIDLTQKNQD